MELMRQLEAEHKKIWDDLSTPKAEMRAANDCEPVLLSGWTDRDISLWDVSGFGGKPERQEILVALCRKKKSWEKISYLLFPAETVFSAGLSLTPSNGNTGDPRIDISHTHFEIKGITGKELCTLLCQVSISNFETGVFTKRDLEKILFEAYDKTVKSPVVESATSQTPHISFSSSATAIQEATTTLVEPEQVFSDTPTPEQMPRPSSSTK